MATTVDELIVKIKADTKGLERSLGNLKKQVAQIEKGNKGGKGISSLGASLKRLTGPAKAAGIALAAVGTATAAALIPVIKIGMAFEDMKSSLTQVFGGADAAAAVFRDIQGFAAKTNFSVQDVTKAYIQLQTSGIRPTEKMLMTFSDAASSSLRPLDAFNSLVRITTRAVGGGLGLEELEQLVNAGIPVYSLLEERTGALREELSDMGQTAEGAKEIMSALNEGLEEMFGGLTIKRMDNLSTKISNMGDAFDTLADHLYEEGGLGTVMKDLVDHITQALTGIVELRRAAIAGVPSRYMKLNPEQQIRAIEALIARREKQAEGQGASVGVSPGSIARGEISSAELRKQNKLAQAYVDALIASQRQLSVNQAKEDEKNTKLLKDRKRSKEIKDNAEELSSIMSAFKSKETGLEETLAFLSIIGGDKMAMKKAGLDGKGLQELLMVVNNELVELREKAKETSDTFMDTMAPAIASMAHSFTNDFVNALIEGGNALDAFKNLAKNIVSQIISTFLQMVIINKILNSVFGGFGGNPLPTMSYQSGSGFQMDKIPGRARGGPVSGGRPYLVGERGPEIFVPNAGGRIMSNSQSSAAGGGVLINQNLNFSTGVQSTVRQEVIKMLPMISDMSKAAVLEASSRGGNFRRGLLGT